MGKLHYKGWDIIPIVLPTADGQWSASCDLAHKDGDGVAVFEGATMQFVRAQEDDAMSAACQEAVRQIDNLIANPDVRLA